LTYRELKQSFSEDESLKRINDQLKAGKGNISDKDLTVSIDISQRTSWEASLTSYLDDIPFQYIGKGDQSILKTLLALDRKAGDTHIILIEEPENHLSYSTMNKLISMIGEKCGGKQLFITTHSTFVLNKLGLDKVIDLPPFYVPVLMRGQCPCWASSKEGDAEGIAVAPQNNFANSFEPVAQTPSRS